MIGDRFRLDFAVYLCFWFSVETHRKVLNTILLVELLHSCCQDTEMILITHETSNLHRWSLNQQGGGWLPTTKRIVCANNNIKTAPSFTDRGQLYTLINHEKQVAGLELVHMVQSIISFSLLLLYNNNTWQILIKAIFFPFQSCVFIVNIWHINTTNL